MTESRVAPDDFLAEYDASKTPFRMRYVLYRDRVVEVRLSSMGNTNWRRTIPLRQLMDSFQEAEAKVRSPQRSLRVATCTGLLALTWVFGLTEPRDRPLDFVYGFVATVLAWFLTPQVPAHWAQFLPTSGAKAENGVAIIDANDGAAFDEFVSLMTRLIKTSHQAASGDPLAGYDAMN